MTQEEKDLLLKDICARLPYGVKIKYHYKRENNVIDEVRELYFSDVETLKYINEYPQDYWCEISWKPYLRPMSSMTNNERLEYFNLTKREILDGGYVTDNSVVDVDNVDEFTNWLNAHHFDYRGLIEKGLAIEAPEGMYNN